MTIFYPRIVTHCFISISGLIRLLRTAVLYSVLPGFLVLSGASFIQPVQAQDNVAGSAAADASVFDIPAGPLDRALDRFARTAGVNLTYDPALISNKVTSGLSGRHDISAGLMLLLAGSSIEVIRQPGGGYTLTAIKLRG